MIGVQPSAYKMALDLGVFEIVFWSTNTTPSNGFSESTAFEFEFLESDSKIISLSRVDFPDPDTPAMPTNLPRGKSTEKFFKLWSEAHLIFKKPLLLMWLASTRAFCSGMRSFFRSHLPVTDSFDFNNSDTVPWKVICPPSSPGCGPISTILSAALITCSSCSTTHTQFPASASFLKIPIKFPISFS